MRQLRRVWRVLREQGPHFVVQKIVLRMFPYVRNQPSALHYSDALAVDWRNAHPAVMHPVTVTRERLVVAWAMSPPGANSGGHQNIFRFIRFLEGAGHEVRIYLYSAIDPHTPAEVRALVSESSSYAKVDAPIEYYPEGDAPDDVDVIVASDWPTAYRSYRDPSRARRLYFVQDFEPVFYPMGTDAVLAENTYRFGFFGITAGNWLATKLRRDYGMPTASFDFGSDDRHYSLTNRGARDDIFFYARPETPRRGFELGVMALDLFHRDRPDHRIVMAGQDVRKLRIPFPYTNLGNVQVSRLNEVYNRSAAALVLSLSNMSLLPLELLSAGTIPVVNDAENNRLVSDNPFIAFTSPVPRAFADRIIEIVDRPDAADFAVRAAESVATASWEASGAQFLEAFERGVRGH